MAFAKSASEREVFQLSEHRKNIFLKTVSPWFRSCYSLHLNEKPKSMTDESVRSTRLFIEAEPHGYGKIANLWEEKIEEMDLRSIDEDTIAILKILFIIRYPSVDKFDSILGLQEPPQDDPIGALFFTIINTDPPGDIEKAVRSYMSTNYLDLLKLPPHLFLKKGEEIEALGWISSASSSKPPGSNDGQLSKKIVKVLSPTIKGMKEKEESLSKGIYPQLEIKDQQKKPDLQKASQVSIKAGQDNKKNTSHGAVQKNTSESQKLVGKGSSSDCLVFKDDLFEFLTTKPPADIFANQMRPADLHFILKQNIHGSLINKVLSMSHKEAWEFCDKEYFIPYFTEKLATFSNPNAESKSFKEMVRAIQVAREDNSDDFDSDGIKRQLNTITTLIRNLDAQLISMGRIVPATAPIAPPFQAVSVPLRQNIQIQAPVFQDVEENLYG